MVLKKMIEISLFEYNALMLDHFKYQTLFNYMKGKDAKYSTVSIEKDFLKALDPFSYSGLERSWNETTD